MGCNERGNLEKEAQIEHDAGVDGGLQDMADDPSLEGVKQFYVNVEREEFKLDTLRDLIDAFPATSQIVVFVNTRQKFDRLAEILKKHEKVSAVHDELDQKTKNIAMREFMSGSSRILIASDHFACGIDVKNVALIVNYDLPYQLEEQYLARIRCNGWYGNKGIAVSFLTEEDETALSDIRSLNNNVVIEELPSDVSDLI